MIDRQRFFDSLRHSLFGGMISQTQVDGLNFILDVFEERFFWTDLRWLAYCLATAFHETAFTMMPVKEYGPQSYIKSRRYYPYYGRGYVQLTWEDNYRKMGQKLGVHLLDKDMDLALDPRIAAEIMFVGMRDGDFTARKLGDYFNEVKDDPLHARRIINGLDRASDIAGYYHKFLAALKAASEEEV